MLAFLGSVRAQSVKTFDREVCAGASLFLDGGLYQILTNDCEITSIKANGTGPELYNGKPDNRITLTASARYHISYKDQSNPGGTVAYAQITVITPPSLKITVSNPKPLPASFCKDTKVTLNATPSNTDVYWTISSDESYSKKGTSAEFTLTESCRITAQSYNACGFVDSSIYFPVITGPDLSNARLILNSTINGSFCMDCGFFPRAEEIVLGATQGTVKTSSITWEDGSTTEETIKTGSFSKKVKVHAVVEQSAGTCGASSTVSRTIDTVITLTVSGGKDCKPTMQTSVSVKPCRDGEVQLRNLNKNQCTIQGRPTLTTEPAHPKIVIQENKDFPYDQGNGRELYRWNVRWEDYAKTDAQPSLTAKANYAIACPYSKSKPSITGSLTKKVNVTIDTNYLTFKYEYCPDQKGTLEISGTQDIITIKEVALVSPSGGLASLFTEKSKQNHLWTLESVNAITKALLSKYADLRLKVTFEVKDGNCRFTLTREERVRLKQKNNCTMKFEMVQTGACIGETRTFRLTNAGDAVADYIEVDPHPVFAFKLNATPCAMEPYYVGAPAVPFQKDNITATIYYHMQGSTEQLSMTQNFPLEVKSCPPTSENINITNTGCPMCPGAQITGYIVFNNPTTQESKVKVDVVSNSVVKRHEKEGGYTPGQNGGRYALRRILFGDMKYRIAVTYNEGDSIYQVSKQLFTMKLSGDKGYGENATDSTIRMAKVCDMAKDASPDSICEGEAVDLFVYSRNFGYETLESITWDSSSVEKVGTGIEDWADYQYADEKGAVKTKKIKRFHYRVVSAKGDGIYPYQVRTKIGDSIFVRRDTIRVAILAKPRIFIQDTVYTCENSGLDLWKYVDSAAVDVKTCTAPGGLVISKATDKDFRVATATLRYNCTNTTWSERITIRTDAEVYNAFIPDAEYCPGETVTLNAKTNGRVTWTRRQLLDGGGLSQADTLVADGENKILSDQMGESSQLYTVTARTGCNKPPFQTVQFWANAKSVPEVNIIDNSACRPEPLVLQTAPFDAAEVDSAKDVKWYVNGAAYILPTVPPADKVTVRCEVTGKNGCGNSAEITMHSYDAPTIKIGIQGNPGFTGKIYCATQNEAIHFTARGADSYAWSSKAGATASSASEYIFNVVSNDVLYLIGSESQKSCQTKDSVSIVLKPKAEVQSDTIACLGEMIYIEPVGEADVNLSLTDPAGAQCSCAWIYVPNYLPEDTGIYVFKFNRNGCEESREVHLRMYPIPDFAFTDTAFCQDDNLKLDVNTGLAADWLRQSRFIWRKDGNELQNKVGNSAYTGGKLNLSDAGTYELEIQVNRCVNQSTVNVRVDAHSHPAFPVDSFYCEGSDFVTDAENQGEGATYEWYSVNRPHMGTSAITKLELGELEMADSAYLKLTVYRGACVDDTSIFIHVRSMPHPQLQAAGSQQDEKGVFYCAGTPLRLDVPDARGEDLMEWYHDGERIEGTDLGSYGVSSADLEDGGKYMFKVERNGCYGETSLYVDVRPLPVPLVGDTFMCSGHVFILDASNEDFPGATFRWTPLGTTGAEAEIHTGGQYSVAMMYDGCEGSQSFVVEERPSPRIGFPSDTVMCQRDSILLEGPGAMETYRWQDGTSGQSYLVNTEGLYSLYVELMGCFDYNEVFVHEDFCSNLYFPSAFTPNGDGNNDSFGPVTTAVDDQVVYSLYIYNRNGEKVFESHRMTEVWDGNYKGAKCPAGVYIYRCKAHAKQNGRNLSADGTVTLLR